MWGESTPFPEWCSGRAPLVVHAQVLHFTLWHRHPDLEACTWARACPCACRSAPASFLVANSTVVVPLADFKLLAAAAVSGRVNGTFPSLPLLQTLRVGYRGQGAEWMARRPALRL